MKCPTCGSEKDVRVTTVVNTSDNENLRERRCKNCGCVFYTTEFEVDYDETFKKEFDVVVKNRSRGYYLVRCEKKPSARTLIRERNNTIVERFKSGESVDKLAEKFKLSNAQIRKILCDHGLTSKRPPEYYAERNSKILELRNSGMSFADVAENVDLSATTVRRMYYALRKESNND